MPSKEDKELETITKLLNKKLGKRIVEPATLMRGLKISRVSTGSFSLDIATGGGFPEARLTEVYGRESVGKSFVCLKAVARTQKKGKRALWIDAEAVFDSVWAEKVGVDLELLHTAKPETAEDTGTVLDTMIRSGKFSLIVLDSVAALEPKEDVEKSMDENERIGNRAMIMNRIIRRLQSALNTKEDGEILNRTTVVFINQVRDRIGIMYGNPETTTGGKGIRFAASLRIELRRGMLLNKNGVKVKQGEDVAGILVKFKTIKNKTYPPFKTGQFIIYTAGEKKGQIDRTEEIIRYGVLSGVIGHSGPSYRFKDKKFLGIARLTNYLEDKPKDVKEVLKQIRKVYNIGE